MHKPGHLRDAFLEAVEAGEWKTPNGVFELDMQCHAAIDAL